MDPTPCPILSKGPPVKNLALWCSRRKRTVLGLWVIALFAPTATETGNLVWHVEGVSIDDASVQGDVAAMLADVAAIPGVRSVASPYDAANPAAATPVSSSTGTAFATITVDKGVNIDAVSAAAHSLDSATTRTAVGGKAFYVQPGGSHGPEGRASSPRSPCCSSCSDRSGPRSCPS
jgi:putative drug exporter of the RND superfamily